MSLRRREFPEVLENLLTAISRGVAAESHPFPPPDANGSSYRHNLQQPPVADVVSVYGSRDGQPHLFRKDVDYTLLDDTPRQTIEWKEGAQLPDPGTLIQVNYYPESAQPVLTDLYTGSVVRTLSESISLEIARLYAQLEVVYQSGFVDTATGSSLDNVVALLGIERVAGGRPAGEVEFTRSPGSRGIINIPAGTRIITADGNVEYETTESVTLAEAQNTIRVVARDLEINDPLPADALTVLPVPIAGIASVTNPAPTAITTQDETDAELRARAKGFLHGSERATLGAIKEAIARQGITADVVEPAGVPGRVEITPHAESIPPELQQRLLTAIEESRPAGVLVTLQGAQPPRKVNLELRLTTIAGLLEQDLRGAQRAAREKIEDYFARLPVREAGSVNRIVGQVLSVPGVQDMSLLSATWSVDGTVENILNTSTGQLDIGGYPTVLGELHIADPNLPTLLSVTISYPEDEDPPEEPEIQAALTGALTYLNEVNATELTPDSSEAERARRVLSYGKLLHVLPLPGKPGASLEAYDDAVVSGTAVPSPDETTVAPYRVQFVLTLESGLSRILSQAADEDYTLTPFERLSLSGVGIQPETSDG
jgi:Baseplate J-like protein